MPRWDRPFSDLDAATSPSPKGDPYAVAMSSPLVGGWQTPVRPQRPEPPPPPPPSDLDQLGSRTRDALAAVDFPSFVSGLITGTFQAIVDSTAQQMREYAQLVSNLSQTLDEFARHNVSDGQVRSWLVETYPADLRLSEGKGGKISLEPTEGSSKPGWLDRFGLGGRELSAQLAEGPLLQAARQELAGERMQQLATMVLIGINRIVIDEGDIKAKLQFHAVAKERTKTAVAMGSTGGQRPDGSHGGFSSMYRPAYQQTTAAVSTVSTNAQRDASLRADLMGEVSVRFSTQTFPIDRFANSSAMQLIDRHARPWTERRQAELSVTGASGAKLSASLPVDPEK